MPEFQTAELEDRGVVAVKGADAHKLLQGLMTNDLDQIQPGAALFAGLLTPQGKILFDFLVVPVAGGYQIELAKDQVPAFIKRLMLYRLRADVTIEDVSTTTKVLVSWGGSTSDQKTLDGTVTVTDPRHPDLGQRSHLARDGVVSVTSTSGDYHAHRIQLGVPEGGRDYVFSDTYPHEALYDDLSGVSFTKGCFIGQEVVSRMEHRKATKKRVVKIVGNGPLPEAGTEITAGKIVLGRLGSSHKNNGLALIRIDRMQDLAKQDTAPKAQDIELQISKPDWANFEF